MIRTLLLLLKAWVRSLFRKLRSPKAMHGEAKKKEKERYSIDPLQNSEYRMISFL